MSDPAKKISFGFSKLAKKTAIVSTSLNKNKQDDDVSKVEFIDCLEGKSIKLRDPVKEDTGPLVIPLTRIKESKSLTQHVDSEIVPDKKSNDEQLETHSTIKSNDKNGVKTEEVKKLNEINKKVVEGKQETLDEIAAREILEELNRKKTEDEEKRVFSVPLTSNAPLGEKESTLEDYDNIPIGDFGMAMLRGMGWAPGKGVGKNEKLVAPTLTVPRPKGMGLGADKVIQSVQKKSSDEDLKMVKGSFIRVIAGSQKDAYGQIEGFDDESGRMIVKLSLTNISVSLNEFMVQLVDSNEYKKNSKVINVSKYEEYKKDEVKKDVNSHAEIQKHDQELRNEDKSSKSYKKYKISRQNQSSSCESEDGSKANESLNNPVSSSNKYKSKPSRSSRSPNIKNRVKEKSHGSSKYLSNPKYSNRHSMDVDKKHRSYSSDSSSSSSSYRYDNKQKSSSSKGKRSARDKSFGRQRSSSNSSSSDSSEHNSRKKTKKHTKKKSSLNKYRSRSRSRSPRRHKHKKSKYMDRH